MWPKCWHNLLTLLMLLLVTSEATKKKITSFYRLTPMKTGAVVSGLNISGEVSPEAIDQIKKDIDTYGLLLFRKQGLINTQRQLEITEWFGSPHRFRRTHEANPNQNIIRMSNDRAEGFHRLMTPGFVTDGANMLVPFTHSLVHVLSAPRTSDTAYMNLCDVIEGMGAEKLADWERLWVEIHPGPPPKTPIVHPFIYEHPTTARKTMVLAPPMLIRWHYDYDLELNQRMNVTPAMSRDISHDLQQLIQEQQDILSHEIKWETGDFMIMDNLAVAHWVKPESQTDQEDIGLRVLHKSLAQGVITPDKGYTVDRSRPIQRRERPRKTDSESGGYRTKRRRPVKREL